MGSLYSEHITWLHRWPAGAKLACMALLGTLLFLFNELWLLAAAGLACALLWCSLGPATHKVRRLIRSVLVAAGLVAGFHLGVGRPGGAGLRSFRCANRAPRAGRGTAHRVGEM